jgi:rod shape-determining protein MreC
MQNLIRLIQKYLLVIVFLVLQIICFTFIITGNNRFHRASIANSSNAVVGSIYEWTHSVTEYFSLREQNNILLEENAKLQEQLLALINKNEIDTLIKVQDTLLQIDYSLQGASVINSTLNLRKNYLTINGGINLKIKEDMAVIGQKGVIGYTIAISESYAVVMPIINENFKLSVTHVNSNSFGLINWFPEDGYQNASVIDIPISVPVSVGDSLVTRGSDAMFPKGILVGIVVSVDNETGESFQQVKIKLAEDFSNINKVKVINFIKQQEIIQLENSIINEPSN